MPYVDLLDGVTTIVLTDGEYHALQEGGWAPRVAQISRATLGGGGPYTDVEEEIATDLFSLNRTELGLLARLQGVQALLLQAERWAEGEFGVRPVRLRYRPDASGLPSVLSAMVLGPSGGVGLPNNLNDYAMVREVEGATIALRRRGPWYADLTTAPTSAAAANPGLMSATFAEGAVPYPSPVELTLGPIPTKTPIGDATTVPPLAGTLLVSDLADALQLVEARLRSNVEDPGFAAIADGGSLPPTAQVMRFTATAAGQVAGLEYVLPCHDDIVTVYLAVRNTDQLDASVQVFVGTVDGFSSSAVAGDLVAIPAGGGGPQILTLPPVPTPITVAGQTVRLRLEVTASAPGQRIDLAYFVVTPVRRVAAIAHDPLDVAGGAGTTLALRFDPRVLELPDGDLRVTRTAAGVAGTPYRVGHRGSIHQLHLSGGTVYARYLATHETYWVATTAARTAAASLTLAAGRRRVYLIPE